MITAAGRTFGNSPAPAKYHLGSANAAAQRTFEHRRVGSPRQRELVHPARKQVGGEPLGFVGWVWLAHGITISIPTLQIARVVADDFEDWHRGSHANATPFRSTPARCR